MNRMCGHETAESVLADFVNGSIADPSSSRDDVADLVADRGAHRIALDGWKAIDAAEKAAGRDAGKKRLKFVSITDFEAAAAGTGR